ncbi:Soluble epoxide hydrolase [Actinomyces bovis]|uniref:Soluble epoxide hydrolase n=1 Tax=Actinomyces bovis TaxID=1658 RepID=A0ABY1VQ75_9ACTO|nr:alpha/beta hydrolase [Actinomyces bovis]SPT54289.1 Soluble epoxide hydrolase [Actinomyces bovis]VEG56375.1 Soluble epoxide hydrolase [Actinomyces israelii]
MPVNVNQPGPWTHRYVSARGTRFHVALAGPESPEAASGTLVVLLHGFPECWWTWRQVLPELGAAGHRTAAVDLRGFGGSDRPPSGYDLVTLAADVTAVVRGLGHEKAVIVGNGLGGEVAWVMSRTAPTLTEAVVPVGAPHPLAVRSLRDRMISGSALQRLSLRVPMLPERSLSTRAGMESLLRSWTAPANRDAVAAEAGFYAELLARPGAATASLRHLRRGRLSRSEVAALNRPVNDPVLAVLGELDPVQPAQAHARDTHYTAGRLQQVTIRGAGHFPQEEAPAEFVAALLPFLREVA